METPTQGKLPDGQTVDTSTVRTIAPVTLWKTKSFWLGIVPLIITAIDTLLSFLGSDTGGPVVALLSSIFGFEAADLQSFLIKITPVWGMIIAWQRGGFGGGIPRPYTLDPKKEKEVIAAIEEGKTAFEKGKEIGAGLKGLVRR